MRASLLPLLVLLLACDDESDLGTADDPATACNESNEACEPEVCGGEGGQMLPGSDCLACHSEGNLVDDKGVARAKESEDGEEDGPFFSAAGTVFADLDGTEPLEGALVRITDANGTLVELTTNAVGNFYTDDALTPPLSAEIEVDGEIAQMTETPDVGACNTCHACDGSVGGKLTGP